MSDNSDAEGLAPSLATQRLLAAATNLRIAPSRRAEASEDASSFAAFTKSYRDWIVTEHGTPGSPQERIERSQLILYAMVGASTLGEGLDLMARFTKTVWSGAVDAQLAPEGSFVALKLDGPSRPGPSGLISAIWGLTMILSELEFLVGGPLTGVEGRVRSARCLPDYLVGMLFDRPLTYEAPDVALMIPRRLLSRAIVVRASDVPGFAASLLEATLGAGRKTANMSALIGELVRNDKLRHVTGSSDLNEIAARLGCSAATVRRRLRAEGAGFREIKEAVFDELAKAWLRDAKIPIETIAERLGFSDVFSFRRSFRRRNAVSPLAFRREVIRPERLAVPAPDGPEAHQSPRLRGR